MHRVITVVQTLEILIILFSQFLTKSIFKKQQTNSAIFANYITSTSFVYVDLFIHRTFIVVMLMDADDA